MGAPRTISVDTLPPYVLLLIAIAYLSFCWVVVWRWQRLSLSGWLNFTFITAVCTQVVRAYLRAVCTEPGFVPANWQPPRGQVLDLKRRQKGNQQNTTRLEEQPGKRASAFTDREFRSTLKAADKDTGSESSLSVKSGNNDGTSVLTMDAVRVIGETLAVTDTMAREDAAAADELLIAAVPRYAHDDLLEQGTATRLRFCQKCNNYKPPRSHHCSDCKRCVLKMDHHCPWVNNCVGAQNHKYFVLFLLYLNIGAVHMIAGFCSALVALLTAATVRTPPSTTDVVLSIIQLTIIIPTFLGVSCLFFFQLSLIGGNTTTIETYEKDMAARRAWKSRRKSFVWVYDRGTCTNFQDVLGNRILHWCCITDHEHAEGFGLDYERSDVLGPAQIV